MILSNDDNSNSEDLENLDTDTDTDSTSDDYCYSEEDEEDEECKKLDEPDIEEESKFHMIAKKVFLTYSQANYLTFDILKERLLNNNVAIYVFSQENHKLPPLEEDEIENSESDSDFDEFEGYYTKNNENTEDLANFDENEEIEGIDTQNNEIDDDLMIFDENDEGSENEGGSIDENEGCGIHLHCYLEYIEKIDIRDPRYFDIEIEHYNDKIKQDVIINYHCNIQYVKVKSACVRYIKKDGLWCSNENDIYNLVQTFKLKSELLKWVYDNNETHKLRFWEQVWLNKPKEKTIDDRIELPFFKWWLNPSLKGANFNTGFNKLSKRPKALYLYGSFETGKTLWVSQFMVDEPKFYVGDWKQFHLYRNERIIIFEDFAEENFKNMTSFFKSLITDSYIDLYTPSFYTSHKIRKDRIVIFTSNKYPLVISFLMRR